MVVGLESVIPGLRYISNHGSRSSTDPRQSIDFSASASEYSGSLNSNDFLSPRIFSDYNPMSSSSSNLAGNIVSFRSSSVGSNASNGLNYIVGSVPSSFEMNQLDENGSTEDVSMDSFDIKEHIDSYLPICPPDQNPISRPRGESFSSEVSDDAGISAQRSRYPLFQINLGPDLLNASSQLLENQSRSRHRRRRLMQNRSSSHQIHHSSPSSNQARPSPSSNINLPPVTPNNSAIPASPTQPDHTFLAGTPSSSTGGRNMVEHVHQNQGSSSEPSKRIRSCHSLPTGCLGLMVSSLNKSLESQAVEVDTSTPTRSNISRRFSDASPLFSINSSVESIENNEPIQPQFRKNTNGQRRNSVASSVSTSSEPFFEQNVGMVSPPSPFTLLMNNQKAWNLLLGNDSDEEGDHTNGMNEDDLDSSTLGDCTNRFSMLALENSGTSNSKSQAIDIRNNPSDSKFPELSLGSPLMNSSVGSPTLDYMHNSKSMAIQSDAQNSSLSPSKYLRSRLDRFSKEKYVTEHSASFGSSLSAGKAKNSSQEPGPSKPRLTANQSHSSTHKSNSNSHYLPPLMFSSAKLDGNTPPRRRRAPRRRRQSELDLISPFQD